MAIDFEKVSFTYDARNMWSQSVLHDVSLHLEEGVFAGIAGATGSGKSTLLQHFNGLLKPTEGKVRVLDFTLEAGGKPLLQELRRRVGLVFQFPEQQLFEDTVEKDLMFGPLNFGMAREDARQSAITALRRVGLDETFLLRNPFHLSGGQMRKVAIASVLAMDPDIIVLDEPTATLDPASRAELAELLARMQQEEGKTVIVVTHRIEEMLPYASLWIVMHQGHKVFQGSRTELVHAAVRLEQEYHLAVPACIKVWNQLAEQYGLEQEEPCLTPEQTAMRMSGLREAGDIQRKGGG